jgi:hypothetical protein
VRHGSRSAVSGLVTLFNIVREIPNETRFSSCYSEVTPNRTSFLLFITISTNCHVSIANKYVYILQVTAIVLNFARVNYAIIPAFQIQVQTIGIWRIEGNRIFGFDYSNNFTIHSSLVFQLLKVEAQCCHSDSRRHYSYSCAYLSRCCLLIIFRIFLPCMFQFWIYFSTGFMATAYLCKWDQNSTVSSDIRVSVLFEKQRILSSTCSACRDNVWCRHIIAAIVYRIKFPNKVRAL